MIIRGGENIAPAEVEAVVQTHPAVEEVAVIGVPDLEWGQKVVAVLTLRPGMQLAPATMVEYCRQRLASFKKPEEIHIVTELPKNHLGKVLRRELRAQFAPAGT
jgi:acyl-CoA synthetase (AMP-forming)/AMP-acid ligase II